MNWLRNFMMGRHGVDKLNIALLVFSMVLTFISSISNLSFLLYLSYLPLILCIYRIFSRNTNARIQENQKFLTYYNPIAAWFKKKFNVLKGSKTHKYFECPSCKQTIRVPKGKGKVTITCPKCSAKFTKNT